LNPLNVFPELNYESPYINECRRVVVRYYLTRDEVLNIYGKELSKEDRSKVDELWKDYRENSGSYYVRNVTTALGTPATDGILAG